MIIFLGKRILVSFMTIAISMAAATAEPGLHAKSAALLDADNDVIMYSKSANDSMANASTTKILTCIVALENSSLDDMVRVSEKSAGQPQVKLGLVEGESYKMQDLLYGMMLESYNDCAYAIAEHIGGSVEGFSDMLNLKANELGCYNTYFLTPNGLDDEDEISFHHTTANDLCNIMKYCAWDSQKSAEFQKITQTMEYGFTDKNGNNMTFTNHNKLLTQTDCCVSGKTGYTSKAGYCYVAAIEKDGKRMCMALLGCGWPDNKNYKWEDAKKLIKYGTSTKESFSFIETGNSKENADADTEEVTTYEPDKKISQKFCETFTLNINKFY
jgi:D-alanyl-D-alanine carboxypeptidase (penicillin-binding protein 5/6)